MNSAVVALRPQICGKLYYPTCLNIISLLCYFITCFLCKNYFYMRTQILSVRHFTTVVRADAHARVNKVSCK